MSKIIKVWNFFSHYINCFSLRVPKEHYLSSSNARNASYQPGNKSQKSPGFCLIFCLVSSIVRSCVFHLFLHLMKKNYILSKRVVQSTFICEEVSKPLSSISISVLSLNNMLVELFTKKFEINCKMSKM